MNPKSIRRYSKPGVRIIVLDLEDCDVICSSMPGDSNATLPNEGWMPWGKSESRKNSDWEGFESN